MSEFFWGLFFGVLIGVFHAQILGIAKPLALSGWAKFQAWRNAR